MGHGHQNCNESIKIQRGPLKQAQMLKQHNQNEKTQPKKLNENSCGSHKSIQRNFI